MRIRTIKKSAQRLLALSAIVLALGITGVEEGVVLCFGGDGHIAIEATGLEGCVEAGEPAPRTASVIASSVSSSHCGPCVDVALATSSVDEAVAAAKPTGPAPATVPVAGCALSVSRLLAATSHLPTTRFISEKPHTVVIRC